MFRVLHIVTNNCSPLNTALVRQAKLDASCRVQVPVRQGLTNHLYRVLRLWRSLRLADAFQ